MGRILALNGALRRCGVWLAGNGATIAAEEQETERGQAILLATMVREVMAASVAGIGGVDLIAVVTGPGSFTGIRAALALAHGLALGGGIGVVGVTVGEAIAEAASSPSDRELWVATDSRRGRVFLERGPRAKAFWLGSLPDPDGPVAIAGDQAIAVTAQLAARGFDVMLTDHRWPTGVGIARAAQKRLAGALLPREPLPLYIDEPEVRLPKLCH